MVPQVILSQPQFIQANETMGKSSCSLTPAISLWRTAISIAFCGFPLREASTRVEFEEPLEGTEFQFPPGPATISAQVTTREVNLDGSSGTDKCIGEQPGKQRSPFSFPLPSRSVGQTCGSRGERNLDGTRGRPLSAGHYDRERGTASHLTGKWSSDLVPNIYVVVLSTRGCVTQRVSRARTFSLGLQRGG